MGEAVTFPFNQLLFIGRNQYEQGALTDMLTQTRTHTDIQYTHAQTDRHIVLPLLFTEGQYNCCPFVLNNFLPCCVDFLF